MLGHSQRQVEVLCTLGAVHVTEGHGHKQVVGSLVGAEDPGMAGQGNVEHLHWQEVLSKYWFAGQVETLLQSHWQVAAFHCWPVGQV